MQYPYQHLLDEEILNVLVPRPTRLIPWSKYDGSMFYGECYLNNDNTKDYFFTLDKEIEFPNPRIGPYRIDYLFKDEMCCCVYYKIIQTHVNSIWEYPEGWNKNKMLYPAVKSGYSELQGEHSLAFWYSINKCPVEIPFIFKGYFLTNDYSTYKDVCECKLSELPEKYKDIIPNVDDE